MVASAGIGAAAPSLPRPPAPEVSDTFPAHPPALAQEMVTVCHFDPARVKELLARHPTLANAAWDWGFGDWETSLGAASHMGRRDIAEVLLAHGARPSLFSAAMLGQLAVVRVFVEAQPGIQATTGPHGLTLLAHARAGGDGARGVVEYLVALGGADPVPAAVELTPGQAQRYVGSYVYGSRPGERIEVRLDRRGLVFERTGTTARNLVHLGDGVFHPPGAPRVRIRFEGAGERATELTVHDPEVVLRASRVTG